MPQIRNRKSKENDTTQEAIADTTAETKEDTTSDTTIAQKPISRSISFEKNVILKLILFSILTLTLPIGVFYATKGYGTTYAGIFAAASANLVLFLYILLAFLEQ